MNERFEIRGKLGAGGAGVVYRAFDRARGAEIALKLLRNATAGDIYRFKREFRALLGVTHPNLVGLYELHGERSDWFLTMELVQGVRFIDWVRPCPERGSHSPPVADTTAETVEAILASSARRRRRIAAPLDRQRLDDAFVQLCDAVHALHHAGKLHRDLKPANVLVEPCGRVVLLDFGLVADLDADGREHGHELAVAIGTPAYMAPEQAAGWPLSSASDWYSVGVMLYEALTGRRPIDVLRGRTGVRLPSPDHDAPSASRHLGMLCMALLDPQPSRRPGGADVLAVLGRAPTTVVPLRPRTVPPVGRERERDTLTAAFTRTRAGEGVSVLLRGPSRAGKSALLAELADELTRTHGAVVLRGCCHERESLPFKALDALIDALTTHLLGLDGPLLEALLPPDVDALSRMFPVTRRIQAIAEPAPPGPHAPGPDELYRRASASLRLLLARLAEHEPLVLVLDDLQWGDAASGELLAELMHPDTAPPLLLVMAHRDEPGPLAGVVEALAHTVIQLA